MAKYEDIEVTGPQRHQIIAAIHWQLDEWGLAMPNVEPLILDLGLGRFEEIGDSEFWVANEVELGYCGKFLFMFDGQTCPRHYHKMKYETFFIVKGRVRMQMADDEFTMNEGDVLPMPQGTYHSFTGLGNALVLEVSMPSVRMDSFFENKDICEDGAA